MKIIFLDIDGVLVTFSTIKKGTVIGSNGGHLHRFNQFCVKQLNEIISQTGAQIVLSSTWRKLHELEELKNHLKDQGVNGFVMGKTPFLSGKERGLEIQEWLDHFGHKDTKFVILDDDSDMAHLKKFLVKTKGMFTGLQPKHAKKAIQMLKD